MCFNLRMCHVASFILGIDQEKELRGGMDSPDKQFIVLEPGHIKMIPQILETIAGTHHQVVLNTLSLNSIELFRTAWQFRNMVKRHIEQINRDITNITIHTRKRSSSVVNDMIATCYQNGLQVPVEVRVPKDDDGS